MFNFELLLRHTYTYVYVLYTDNISPELSKINYSFFSSAPSIRPEYYSLCSPLWWMMIYGECVTIPEKKSYTFINQSVSAFLHWCGAVSNVKYCFRKALTERMRTCTYVPCDSIDSKKKMLWWSALIMSSVFMSEKNVYGSSTLFWPLLANVM